MEEKMDKFIVNIIHRPEMVPEYAEKGFKYNKRLNVLYIFVQDVQPFVISEQKCLFPKNGIYLVQRIYFAGKFVLLFFGAVFSVRYFYCRSLFCLLWYFP